MRKAATLITLALAAATCHGQKLPVVSERELKRAMQGALKDADSAKFKDLLSKIDHSRGSIMLICGKVNAKNSFGAYSGFQPFIAASPNEGKGLYILVGIGDGAKEVCDRTF